jgi:uncharacterized membrane protein
MIKVLACLAVLPLIIAFACSLAGAWMVLPFAGLELLGVAYAFYLIHCHAGDYESITITGDSVAIEQRSYKNISQVVFHRCWAKIVLRDCPGGEQRLWLRSHGKEVEIGRYMNNEERLFLARQLQQLTGAGY